MCVPCACASGFCFFDYWDGGIFLFFYAALSGRWMRRWFLYPARWAGLRYVGFSGRGDGLLFDELTFSHPPPFIRWLPSVDVTEYVYMPTQAWAWHPAFVFLIIGIMEFFCFFMLPFQGDRWEGGFFTQPVGLG